MNSRRHSNRRVLISNNAPLSRVDGGKRNNLVRFFLRGKLSAQSCTMAFCTARSVTGSGRGRVAGKIDGLSLGSHFFRGPRQGDDINDVENL